MRIGYQALVAASAAVLLAAGAMAAEKIGKPLKPGKSPASELRQEEWRQRAMDAHAEAPGDVPFTGSARALDERGDRRDGEDAGGGRLRKDGEEDGNR